MDSIIYSIVFSKEYVPGQYLRIPGNFWKLLPHEEVDYLQLDKIK